MKSNDKLLSILMMGRDDNYTVDFKYRIATTLNHIAYNLKQLGRLDEVEIMITDWGSEIPLAQTLYLSPDAGQICRFVYVPLELIRQMQNGGEGFNAACAPNTGMRRAAGKFLMVSATDTLIPLNSLESILKLLAGQLSLPVDIVRTYFLLRRYQIPWQFVIRQPNIEELDRYLLLAPYAVKETWPAFCLGDGAGAMIMERSLWHKFRGFDERFSGWGGADTEMEMRVGYFHPWLELSILGVSLYHMEHSHLDGRTAVLKQKAIRQFDEVFTKDPIKDFGSYQVNSEDWGLGNYELKIQTAQNIQTGEKISEAKKIEPWNQSRQEIFSQLTGRLVREHVRQMVETIITYRGGRTVRDHIRQIFELLFVGSRYLDSLFLLSWYSLYHYPRTYLELGVKKVFASATVAAACPSVEMHLVYNWPGFPQPFVPLVISKVLDKLVNYRGYARFLNDENNTGLRRLRDSFIGPFFIDLALVQEESEETFKQITELLPNLAAGGALVYSSKSADRFTAAWDDIQKKFPHFIYLKCRDSNTGMILAIALSSNEHQESKDYDCHFSTGWVWLSLLKCVFTRIFITSSKIGKSFCSSGDK